MASDPPEQGALRTSASSESGGTASEAAAPLANPPAKPLLQPAQGQQAMQDEQNGLAELLWCKSAVYVNPRAAASSPANAGLAGFLAIVRAKNDQGAWKHLVSWIPEKLVEGTRDFDAFVLVELSSQVRHLGLPSSVGRTSPDSDPQNERDVLVHLPPPMDEQAMPATDSPRSYAFSHPIASLYSVQVRPPTLTSWVGTVTISLFGGETLPALHFHDDESQSTLLDQDRRASVAAVATSAGSSQKSSSSSPSGSASPTVSLPSWGGEAFVSRLKKHARVVRSQLDPTVFLINPSRLDLEAHVAGLALTDEADVPIGAMQGVRARRPESAPAAEGGRAAAPSQRTSILHQSSPVSGSSGRTRQRMHHSQLVSKAPAATSDGAASTEKSSAASPSAGGAQDWPDDLTGSRSSSAFDAGNGGMDALTFNVLNGFSRITRSARQISQQAASTVLSHPLAKPLAKHVPKPIAQFALAPGEVSKLTDAAGVGAYDAARVYLAKWARIVAEEGERARRVEYGVDDAAFLGDELGESTGVFEVLAKTYHLQEKPRSTRAPNTPIQLEEWRAWFEPEEGTLLLDEHEARRRIFQRGLADNDVRKQVWPFLLKLYPWTSSRAERTAIAEAKR